MRPGPGTGPCHHRGILRKGGWEWPNRGVKMQSDITASAADAVRKGFVAVDGGLVHFVRMGNGPPVVLLHASPCSAKVMAPLQALWAPHFSTFAFDLPGFGLSDPPPGETVETWQLADIIAGAIRGLGLEQVAAYGRHTGAGVAVEMAKRHPDLVSMALTDGFPVFSQPYDEARLATYLPPIEPSWEGGHLVWTWFRYREQHIFWPWDRAEVEHRSDCDVPDLDFLHRGVVELLEAGDNYRKVYASAFRHAGLAMIGDVKVPVCFGNRPGDSQHKTMKLYPTTAWLREFPRDGLEAAAQERRVLALHPPRGAVPPHAPRIDAAGASLTDYITTRAGQAYVRGEGLDRPGLPVVVLHDLPGSVELHEDLIQALAAHRPVLAMDLSGNGHSTLPAGLPVDIARWAVELENLLDATGKPRVILHACGTAAAVAAEFACRAPDRVAGIVLQSPPLLPPGWARAHGADYAPDVAPTRDGGHLLRLWHHLRDQELWWPWFEQTRATARTTPHRIAPADLHRRAVALLRQPAHYRPIWQAVLADDLATRLAGLDLPIRIVYRETDLFARFRDRAAILCADPAPLALPDDAVATAAALATWMAPLDLSSAADAGTAPPPRATAPEGTAHAPG